MHANFIKDKKWQNVRKKEVFDWEDEDQEEIIWVSKSEIKRDAEDLKQLGEKIVNLTKANLAKIPLDESLLDAIELAQRLQKKLAAVNYSISANYFEELMLSHS